MGANFNAQMPLAPTLRNFVFIKAHIFGADRAESLALVRRLNLVWMQSKAHIPNKSVKDDKRHMVILSVEGVGKNDSASY